MFLGVRMLGSVCVSLSDKPKKIKAVINDLKNIVYLLIWTD
jgi:hypothetical protein